MPFISVFEHIMYGEDIMYGVQSTAPDKPNLHLAKVEDLEKELAKRKEVCTSIQMHSCMLRTYPMIQHTLCSSP